MFGNLHVVTEVVDDEEDVELCCDPALDPVEQSAQSASFPGLIGPGKAISRRLAPRLGAFRRRVATDAFRVGKVALRRFLRVLRNSPSLNFLRSFFM